MGLTPDEIVNYPLKQAVRGYSVKQVDDLLDQIADEIERLQLQVAELRARAERAELRASDASETEETLKRTLVTAQRAAEQSLEESRSRASEILEDARREAAAALDEARQEAERIRRESIQTLRDEEAELRRRRAALETNVDALRRFEEGYRADLRTHLEGQLRRLDDLGSRGAAPSLPPELDAELPDPLDDLDDIDDLGDLDDDGLFPGGPSLTVRVHDDADEPAAEDASDAGDDADDDPDREERASSGPLNLDR